MIVYNELVAVTTGAALLGFAAFLRDLLRGKRIESEGWAGFFGLTGVLLLVLGLHTTVTWPYGGDGFEYANIAFGQPEATLEQIERSARVAAAEEFIRDLPLRYDTMVGEYGSTLSGGQRQRLSIARAVLLDPPILLLDDATASVDAETEHEISTALEGASAGRTTILISNRLSSLMRCQRVLVLEARPILGGRASAVRDPITGETIDNGQHVLMGCYDETLAFLRRIGAADRVWRQSGLALTIAVICRNNASTLAGESGGVIASFPPSWRSRAARSR